MIQRIQSLHLLLTSILGIFLAAGSLIDFSDKSGNHFSVSISDIFADQSLQHEIVTHTSFLIWVIIFILAAIVLISLAAIGLYKKRRSQMILTLVLIILSSLLLITLAGFAYIITGEHNLSLAFSYRMIIPELLLLFTILAYLGMMKDDRLIRSYDRLR